MGREALREQSVSERGRRKARYVGVEGVRVVVSESDKTELIPARLRTDANTNLTYAY
jgi:hypothetical protein